MVYTIYSNRIHKYLHFFLLLLCIDLSFYVQKGLGNRPFFIFSGFSLPVISKHDFRPEKVFS